MLKLSNEVLCFIVLACIALFFVSFWYFLEHFVILAPVGLALFFISRHHWRKDIAKVAARDVGIEQDNVRPIRGGKNAS